MIAIRNRKIQRLWQTGAAAALALAVQPPALAQDINNGRQLYDLHCASCHGFDGRPMTPNTPDFTRGDGLMKLDDELYLAIRDGINEMPGYRALLKKREILDVIAYIRTFF